MTLAALFLIRKFDPVDIPPSLQAALIGILAGIIVGLFFYQHYKRNYYWWFSMIAGLFASFLAYRFFPVGEEGDGEVWKVVLQFGLPLAAAWVVNRYLYRLKRKSRRRKRASHSSSMQTRLKEAEDLFKNQD